MRVNVFLAFLLIWINSTAQLKILNHSLLPDSPDMLYTGVDNHISLTGEKITPRHMLVVKGAGSSVTKPRDGEYIVRVKQTGICTLQVFYKQKKILEKEYTVDIPLAARVTFAGTLDTVIAKNKILYNPFFRTVIPGSHYRVPNEVMSFTATFIYNNDIVVTTAMNNALTREQLHHVQQLRSGDIIQFDQIRISCAGGRATSYPSFQIRIE